MKYFTSLTTYCLSLLLFFSSCRPELIVPPAVEVCGPLNTPTTWSHVEGRSVDYIIGCNLLVNDSLRILPGTVIQLKQNAGIEVTGSGILIAVGSQSSRITFTSFPGTTWNSIVIYSKNDANQISHCDISRGGNASLTTPDAMVVVGQDVYAEGEVTIRDCVFESSVANGLYINSQSRVRYFANNTFRNNAGYPVTVTTENVSDLNSTASFSGNGNSYVEIRDCVTPTGEGQTIPKLSIGYKINQAVRFRGYDTIQAGVNITFSSSGSIAFEDFNNNTTYVNAAGTSADPILLRAEPGANWTGVIQRSKGTFILQHVRIENAGSTENFNGQQASVIVENQASNVSIRDCVFDGSGGFGIDLGGAPTYNSDIATSNLFLNCTDGTIKF